VSLDGRTFVEPPDTWKPTDTTRPDLWFAGAPQTLAGDLVREGITGTSAHVAEPFFSAMIRPQVLFPAYLRGLNLAEAFYLSMPYLSWQTMILGDPLCAVMPREAVPAAELESKVDGETDLPVHLSTRRLALMLAGDPRLNTAAIKLGMRAENAFSQGDIVAGEAFLTRAADLEPRLTGVQVRLASLLESAGKVADAMARYRKVLDLEPNNALALNNLAYALAVHSGSPRDALPLAERAYRLVPDLPDIADTLGWIHHLLGDDRIAAGLVDRAVRGAPDNLDMRLHAAVVFASVGDKARAKLELDAALKLDPASASRPEASLARQLIGGTLF
jgi:Flp pilus assembly protein TadD